MKKQSRKLNTFTIQFISDENVTKTHVHTANVKARSLINSFIKGDSPYKSMTVVKTQKNPPKPTMKTVKVGKSKRLISCA